MTVKFIRQIDTFNAGANVTTPSTAPAIRRPRSTRRSMLVLRYEAFTQPRGIGCEHFFEHAI